MKRPITLRPGMRVTYTDLDFDSTREFLVMDAAPYQALESRERLHKLVMTSPVARALEGAVIGDVVEVDVPIGRRRLRVDMVR